MNQKTQKKRVSDIKNTEQRDGSQSKLGFFNRSSLKIEARRFFEKSTRPPCSKMPFKFTAPSQTAVCYLKTNCCKVKFIPRSEQGLHFCLSAFQG
jgi:hypothetical protein